MEREKCYVILGPMIEVLVVCWAYVIKATTGVRFECSHFNRCFLICFLIIMRAKCTSCREQKGPL